MAADRPRRLVYTSSVAAYGYHSDNPVPITEEVPARGSPEHYYSEQRAACEAPLAEITSGTPLDVCVLRPCIVAGPKAPALAEAMPWNQLPGPVKRVAQALPLLKPPFPDPGTPLQLVHHDDVAAAIALAATTSAAPGAYNIAADGVLSMSDLADRPLALRAIGAGVAACRAHVGGDGHHKGKVRAGLETEIHCRRDTVGAGRGDLAHCV